MRLFILYSRGPFGFNKCSFDHDVVLVCCAPSAGIACIALSFIDGGGRPIQASALDGSARERTESSSAALCPEHFQELTAVLKVGAVGVSPAAGNIQMSCGRYKMEHEAKNDEPMEGL